MDSCSEKHAVYSNVTFKTGYAKAQMADLRAPDSGEKRVEGKGTSKSEVRAIDLALDLLANDTVLLGVYLVQNHAQQAGAVLAVALLANQLQTVCSRKMKRPY